MPSNDIPVTRELQQDARAWAKLTGTNYTAALRQMRSPLAQGFFGERTSARRLIEVLEMHPLIGSADDALVLGEDGFHSDRPWVFDGQTDFVELALITDMLRIFTPIPASAVPEVSSYSLKHTAERFLGESCPYVSNGKVIWAAAALGLPLVESAQDGPNLLVGVAEREHDYVARMSGAGQNKPRVHHYRPAGYEHLRAALTAHASGEGIDRQWVPSVAVEEDAPFHDWLQLQAGRDDVVGDFAEDYAASVRRSEHRIARTSAELLNILDEVPTSLDARNAARTLIAEWDELTSPAKQIRTEQIAASSYEHSGWGAGSGDIERYIYRCPCGKGRIVEEHDNTPGFREHEHWFECDSCRGQWRFVAGRSVRDWLVEPLPASAG